MAAPQRAWEGQPKSLEDCLSGVFNEQVEFDPRLLPYWFWISVDVMQPEELEFCVIACREAIWQQRFTDAGIIRELFQRFVWKTSWNEDSSSHGWAALALRLAANCVVTSRDLRMYLMPETWRLSGPLKQESLCGWTIALLANLLYADDDNKASNAAHLASNQLHRHVAEVLCILPPSDRFHGIALDILEEMVDADVNCDTNESLPSAFAFSRLCQSIERWTSIDSESVELVLQMNQILSQYLGSDDFRRVALLKYRTDFTEKEPDLWPDGCFDLFRYLQLLSESPLLCTPTEDETYLEVVATTKELLDLLGQISEALVEGTELPSRGKLLQSDRLFKACVASVHTDGTPDAPRYSVDLSYVVLYHATKDDQTACAAVHELALEEATLKHFTNQNRKSGLPLYQALHSYKALFLSNVFHCPLNKEKLFAKDLLWRLYYHGTSKNQKWLPIHLTRKLLANAEPKTIKGVLVLDDSDARQDRPGIPRIFDLIDSLPDQQSLRERLLLPSEQPGDGPRATQPPQLDDPSSITIDIVAILRVCLPLLLMPGKPPNNKAVEPWCWIQKNLIWAAANCLIAGFNTRYGPDISRAVVALVYITEYARFLGHDLVHEVVLSLHPHGWDRVRMIGLYAVAPEKAWLSVREDLENVIILLSKLVQAAGQAQEAGEVWPEVEALRACQDSLSRTRQEVLSLTSNSIQA